ncbi:MAG TPA: VWA domain-containing protein [Anaerolineae bacterium]|nr:VWA domain-containing protein [Anaerolineae bacterium]
MQKILKYIYIFFLASALIFTAGCQSKEIPEQAPQGDITLQITQVDTSEFPLVRVYISVLDKNGEPLAVNPSKLVLLEDGVPINPQDIQGMDEVSSLTSLMVVDISGSMNFAGKLDAAKAVAEQYVDQMRAGDQAGLVTFNTKVGVVQDITGDHEALKEAIASIQARDDTAIWDALTASVELLNPLPGRKAIIMLTDGMDNASQSTPEDILGSIGFSGLSISTVGFGVQPEGEEVPDEYEGIDEPTLRMLAENAGGRYGYAEDQNALALLYDQIRRALQSEVVISYVTPIALRDGVNRALSVTLADNWQGVSAQSEAVFNPGGLVPEVAQPASWMLFGGLLGLLVVLLLIPLIVLLIGNKGKKKKRKVHIKLKD